jgi:hypothetical protein
MINNFFIIINWTQFVLIFIISIIVIQQMLFTDIVENKLDKIFKLKTN